MDLLLTPQAHFSGGNFVAPEGDYVYYTQARFCISVCVCAYMYTLYVCIDTQMYDWG